MIHTITTNGHLYRINRDRKFLQDKIDKRRTVWLVSLITLIVGSAVILYPIYSGFWK